MKSKRWNVILFIAACGAINYTDRSAFGITAPLFSKELGIGPAELGTAYEGLLKRKDEFLGVVVRW